MQYFASTTLLGGFTVPVSREPGSILIGGEIVWVPFLSADQQRVGFNGTKPEDLNKAPFVPRPRIVIALPAAFTTAVAFIPPVETFGIDPKLVAVALERPIYQSDTWAMGWRVYGQIGTAKAAFTCPQEAVAFTPGTTQNLWGCLETSSDVATLRYIGFELGLGQSTADRFVTPHAAIAVNYFQNEFEVNARRLDIFNGARQEFIDRTVQKSRATTFSLTGGVGFRLGDRVKEPSICSTRRCWSGGEPARRVRTTACSMRRHSLLTSYVERTAAASRQLLARVGGEGRSPEISVGRSAKNRENSAKRHAIRGL